MFYDRARPFQKTTGRQGWSLKEMGLVNQRNAGLLKLINKLLDGESVAKDHERLFKAVSNQKSNIQAFITSGYIYLVFDEKELLTYVGVAHDPIHRIQSHIYKRQIPINPQTWTISIIKVDSYEDALEIESCLIDAFRPHWNIAKKK